MILEQRKINKILIIALFSILSFTACNNKVDGASKKVGNLLIKTNDYSYDHYKYQEAHYMNYNEIFDLKGTQKATGRYADITPDKKISWDVKEIVEYEQTPIAKDMINKITLDGKAIKLPMEFKDLGIEYEEFEKVDYSKFADKMTPFTITNTKNRHYIITHNILNSKNIFFDIMNKDKFLIGININKNDKKIRGLFNDRLDNISIKELKVNGIGAGNTFNEMYTKFGKPNVISPDDEYFGRSVIYYFDDTKNNMEYIIKFKHENMLYNKDTEQKENVKPNVIIGISLTIIRNPSDIDIKN